MTRTRLDLFAGLGGFSAAFEDSEAWDVVTVEIDPDFEPDIQADVMDLRPSDLPDADVVLVGQPCPLFSTAGNHDEWDGKRPVGQRAKKHVALVYHTLGLIRSIDPTYWFLENPRGRLRWILGPPTGTVTYCQYGTDYQKPTDLWGEHPPGLTYRSCPAGADCHEANGDDDGTSAIASMPADYSERSKVPYELSKAIREAVDDAFAAPTYEQATLQEAADESHKPLT